MIRLALRVSREQAEVALAQLLELAPAGVEEVDLGEQGIEYAVYGARGELPSLPDLRVAAGDALVDVSTSEVGEDWAVRWRQFHHPVLLSPPGGAPPSVPALHVRPPWLPAHRSCTGGRAVAEIVIDPAQAFGTGSHPTTRMCLELLLELAALDLAQGPLIDLGCGSGVLSIAAAHLGWDPVVGLDHEIESVTATRENATINGVELQSRRHDLREDGLCADVLVGTRPTVVANLLRPLLLHLAGSMPFAPSHLMASGVLTTEVDGVAAAFADRLGLVERARRQSGEWCALWLEPAAG